ncbi:MAG TPA: Asp-tRNA(Asn)/Glu-tRNA(Gln) amidotransferase subunit GatB [Spirochaetota bacterium]|nr:Asp-tRNA(Asn)/Glu-tRNA(Gln) amidotransferase subunit GatB [Spirochaetota bacterium]
MKWDMVIGIETHAQLNTRTKLFCGCRTSFGDDPNVNTCPVCLGHPGVLPVFNIEARNKAVAAGLALNCRINSMSQFDRKNYFYPDSPKAYQITQLFHPICSDGHLTITVKKDNTVYNKTIRINRIHIEEDAGKLKHAGADESHVDLNRAGTPLIEIVSEADISSADEAVAYMQKLRSLFLYAGVSNCDMEKGNFRGDVNLSLKPAGSKQWGNRTEIKNMNSFKSIHASIISEFKRQKKILENGKKIITETLLFDIEKQKTRPMRSKEEAHDYRYFPEPDLVPCHISNAEIKNIAASLPELPDAKFKRFTEEYGLNSYDAGILVADKHLAAYYEKAVAACREQPKKICNWILVEVNSYLNENNLTITDFSLPAEHIGLLFQEIGKGTINGKMAKEIFPEMIQSGHKPAAIIKAKGLQQVTDDSLINSIIDTLLAENPDVVKQFKAGNTKVVGFFIGRVMKATNGKANPKLVNQLLNHKLK